MQSIAKKPRLSSQKRKIESATMKSYRHRLPADYLDDLVMPLYKYTWKGFGINNIFYHSNMEFIDGKVPNTKAGDWNSFNCLPGRQCYMEFCALPLYDMANNPGITINPTQGNFLRTRSVADLLDSCGRNQQNSSFHTNASGDNINDTADNDFSWYSMFNSGQGSAVINTVNTLDTATMRKRLNTIFYYEGGNQTHKFLNTTSLPVYVEVIEFKPKNPMAYSAHRGDYGTGTNTNAIAFPGLWETISTDLSRLRDYEDTTGVNMADRNNLGPDQLWNEFDDKGFHYTKFCKETNMRWVVSEKKVHRIDPGQTFVYNMVLPPFTLKLKDLYDYINYYYNHVSGFIGAHALSSNSNFQNAFFPLFSKFASVRMWGSTAYLSSSTGVDPGENSADTYANSFTYPGLTSDVKTMNSGPIRATATHPVRMTHSVTETHKCRYLGSYEKFSEDTYNYMPNAADKSQIVLADRMMFVDPLENEAQHVTGDH